MALLKCTCQLISFKSLSSQPYTDKGWTLQSYILTKKNTGFLLLSLTWSQLEGHAPLLVLTPSPGRCKCWLNKDVYLFLWSF